MDKQKRRAAPVGGSSLLGIFAVLCLTIFALLSLSTAAAGQRLSNQSAQAVQAYYRAECEAEAILAQLRAGVVPEGVAVENNVYSYTCPISEGQELKVSVAVTGEAFEILRWQSVSTVQWEADTDLELWDGT